MYARVLIPAILMAMIAGFCTSETGIPPDEKQLLAQIRDDIVKDLKENLLPFWKEFSVDHNDPKEGFYGAIARDGTGIAGANKHNVLFTRYLWTYTAAFRVLGDDESLQLAHRAWNYLSAHFWDMEKGGVFWELNSEGIVSDSTKMTYGLSFAIYAFSEYYRVTRNKESLQKAVEIFKLLEQHAWDREFGGYFEAFTADWKHIEGKGLAAGRSKSMNSHLHLMEAYTNLYRVWPDEMLEERLRALIDIFLTRILNTRTYHLELFFERDWTVYGRFDSYGHDIEFSWLLEEAARVLGDKELIRETEELAVKIAGTQLAEGMNPEGAMIYERIGEDRYRTNIAWWVQAEAVVGFLNAWEISGDRRFLEAAAGVWNYISKKMVDREHGGWFPDLDQDGKPRPDRLKADAWTCPYHNVRMGLEVYERFCNL